MTFPTVAARPLLLPALNQPGPGSAIGQRALLADPAASTGSACNDAMAMIYACLSKQNAEHTKSGQSGVEANRATRDAAYKQEMDALARERRADGEGSKGFFASVGGLFDDVLSDVSKLHLSDAVNDASSDVKAAWDSPKFWNDVEFGAHVVADVAAVVGSACVTAATFGAGAASVVVVAALVLSTAGAVESNCHVLEACGVDAKIGSWIGVGMSVGGALVGGVGGLMAAPERLCTAALAAKSAGSVMQGAAGGADIVAGGAHVKSGKFAADGQDARADATEADHKMRSIARVIDMIIDGIKDSSASHERAIQSLEGAMKTNDDTLVLASGRMA